MRFFSIIAMAFIVTGCAEPEPEQPAEIPAYDPQNPGPWCLAAAEVLGDPWLAPGQVQALLIIMENKGCLS